MPIRRATENTNDRGSASAKNGYFPSRHNRDITEETSFRAYPGQFDHSRGHRCVNEHTASNEELTTGTRVIEEYHRNVDVREYGKLRDTQVESHAIVRMDSVHYGHRNAFGKKSRKKRGAELELARNGETFDGQRLYSSLGRRGKTNNWRNPYSFDPIGDTGSFSLYPRSMQDLTDLDIERILERDTNFRVPLSSFRSRDYLMEGYRRMGDEENQSTEIDDKRHETAYVPGRVHYEREYRIYGKDTVALIYYKTCYL